MNPFPYLLEQILMHFLARRWASCTLLSIPSHDIRSYVDWLVRWLEPEIDGGMHGYYYTTYIIILTTDISRSFQRGGQNDAHEFYLKMMESIEKKT